MVRKPLVVLSVAAAFAGAANAQDEEPDLSFLEYLGSWQEGDEEWLVVVEMEDERVDEDEASGTDEEKDGTDEN
ncbi:MAG: hypothetical protein PVH89_01300 [Gammaproteobacteria bacterium]|jgi:hypothetical protein